MTGPKKPMHKDVPTHEHHVRAEIDKVHPGHASGEVSYNDLAEEQMLGEKPNPNVVVNPANGLG